MAKDLDGVDITANFDVPVSNPFSGIKDTFTGAVDRWMESVITTPAIHWANIALGGFLGGTNAVTNIHRFSSIDIGGGKRVVLGILTLGSTEILNGMGSDSASGLLRNTANVINAVLDELKDPNIEGIPIHAVKETESRDVEVNEQLTIAMYSSDVVGTVVEGAANKDIVVDNATPRLKEWQVNGYLTSFPEGLDPYLILKPGLKVQKMLLDLYTQSRRPVWYKTHDGSFKKVLIKHMDTAYNPNHLNSVELNLTLVEFKVLAASTETLGTLLGKLKSAVGG